MVAFSVYKSSKYLFDCVGITDATSQPYPTVSFDAIEALRLNTVDVVKRVDYAEVDRLIASCVQHPPQTVVVPSAHGDTVQFQKFTKYLKAKQRAGVVLLEDGQLLILAPLEKDDLGLRCVVVKAKSTAETSALELPNKTTATVPRQVENVNILRPSGLEQTSEQLRRRRVRPRSRGRSQEGVADAEHDDLQTEAKQSNQAAVGTPATEPNDKLEMLYHLPRLERATKIAQFRQEYEAFNELHYEILREWAKSDLNS